MRFARRVIRGVRRRLARRPRPAGHVVAATGADGSAVLVCSVTPGPSKTIRADQLGLVHLTGWSASLADVPHVIRITRGNLEQLAPPMSLRPDLVRDVRRHGYRGFAKGTIRRISIFLHVPEGESSRTFDVSVTAGGDTCHLGSFTVVRRAGKRSEDGFTRAEYKEVWNSVSGDVDHAKTAVAGYVDEEEFKRTAAATALTLQRTTGLRPSDVVLEIGAGVGRAGPAIAPLVRKWIATDVSEQMLGFARERNKKFQNIDYVPLSGWDLEPIEDCSVDVVYCTVVFMHLDEWERFNYVREAHRVLRPGGRIYVDNYNLLSTPGWEFFLGVIENHHPLNRPPNVSRSSTPEELAAHLERAGFTDVVAMGPDEALFCWAFGTKAD